MLGARPRRGVWVLPWPRARQRMPPRDACARRSMYCKTRPQASAQSVRRARALTKEGVHPMLLALLPKTKYTQIEVGGEGPGAFSGSLCRRCENVHAVAYDSTPCRSRYLKPLSASPHSSQYTALITSLPCLRLRTSHAERGGAGSVHGAVEDVPPRRHRV